MINASCRSGSLTLFNAHRWGRGGFRHFTCLTIIPTNCNSNWMINTWGSLLVSNLMRMNHNTIITVYRKTIPCQEEAIGKMKFIYCPG
ncbi:hypothetical protein GGR58DRAFT_467329 [Xylaria digitata]|nr:hypothetical protein GGR58DRAFT_467329 [Xylaria digitata]